MGKRLEEQSLAIVLTPAAREGYDPVYGARPLRRAVQRYLENPLASRILADDFKTGEAVEVDMNPDVQGLAFSKATKQPEKKSPSRKWKAT